MTDLEIIDATEYTYTEWTGYFIAPLDGKYQFRIAGDDAQRLLMSIPEVDEAATTPEYSPQEYTIDPSNARVILDKPSWNPRRVYTNWSDWLHMKAG